MAIRTYSGTLTADGSGNAIATIEGNGLVSLVFIEPVGSVNGASTCAVREEFTNADRAVVAATGCSSAVTLWSQSSNGLFSISNERDLELVIASATSGDDFQYYVDVIVDD